MDAAARIRPLAGSVRVPEPNDAVLKDECALTFDTALSAGGLFISLTSWQAYGTQALAMQPGGLYLHEQCSKVPIPEEETKDAAPVTQLGLNVPGGFQSGGGFKYESERAVVLVGANGAVEAKMPYPSEELPDMISLCCKAIVDHEGGRKKAELDAFLIDDFRPVSKFADGLLQLPPNRKISPNPKDWKCEESGDTTNLWLNLSDGHIGGGRRYFDGSGGSNGALDHFNHEKEKGNIYPLVVKLGTITPQGADVYSYHPDEDGMVTDPNLQKHLEHWGIDIMQMEKTDKSLAEMEVELNQKYQNSKILESGKELERLSGTGLCGITNLGNTCYLNSIMQLVSRIPEVEGRYKDTSFALRKVDQPDTDLLAQFAKLVNALVTDRYATSTEDELGKDVEIFEHI
jgi:ubiquitin carboxyl-terminal hydrolase 5/13